MQELRLIGCCACVCMCVSVCVMDSDRAARRQGRA